MPDGQHESSAAALLPHFDIFNPEHVEHGDEVLELARTTCPVSHTSATGGYYIAASYQHATEVLKDPKTFSSVGYTNIAGNGGIIMPPIDADEPLHRHYRNLLGPFFHPRFIADSEPQLREMAGELIDGFVDRGSCDFMSEFVAPFVTDVLAKTVFDADDPEIFTAASAANDRVSEGDQAAFGEFWDLMVTFTEKHDGSGDGLMGAIKNGVVDGRPMSHDEQVGMVLILFSGGLDTTKVGISEIVYAMTQHSDLEGRLRTPGWEKSTLDELLRATSPVSALGRVATRDVELGGQLIRKGERILVHYLSANRDAAQFDAPDDLVFDRERNPHIAFGLGIHRCVGIHLARAQIRVAVSELLNRVSNVRLAPGAQVSRRSGISPVLRELRLEFDKR